jgi:2-dehydro-3-deoxygalactonokinase
MIGVDWGTSSLRAYRMAADGRIRDRRASPTGILHVTDGAFAATLRREIGAWLADGERHVLMSGMIGSRQGWVEATYLPCPAGAADLAAALLPVPFDGAQVLLVPGLSDADEADTPEVMRGEETQIVGTLADAADAIACLPGSHSKWVRVIAGRINAFRTYMTGETFAALRSATILGRMMTDGPTDLAAFDRGVARAGEAGHLLRQLFGVRTLGLFGRLAEGESASYLSGLLIGHEVRAARPAGESVHLIGTPELCALYARAILAQGGTPLPAAPDAAASGLHLIGRTAPWT